MLLEDLHGRSLAGTDAVAERLAADGVVMLHEADLAGLRALLATWTVPASHPHQQESGVTVIEPRPGTDGLTGMAGFRREDLFPHTDRSLAADPPSLLASVMMVPAESGGDLLLVDGAEILAQLVRRFGVQAVARLQLNVSDGRRLPLVRLEKGLARIRFRSDEVADIRDDIICPPIAEVWRSLVSAAAPVRLQTGDGYLLHNHRYLHGRRRFTGTRRLVRILANVATGHRFSWLNEGFCHGHR